MVEEWERSEAVPWRRTAVSSIWTQCLGTVASGNIRILFTHSCRMDVGMLAAGQMSCKQLGKEMLPLLLALFGRVVPWQSCWSSQTASLPLNISCTSDDDDAFPLPSLFICCSLHNNSNKQQKCTVNWSIAVLTSSYLEGAKEAQSAPAI